MKSTKTKTFTFLLVLSLFTALSFSGLTDKKENYIVQASFFDIIRALVTINPLELDVTAPAEAAINKVFKVEAVATNKGEDTIKNVKAQIFLPEGLVLLKRESPQQMGVIRGKREKKVSWSVRGDSIGYYIISVLVSGELRGEILSADGTAKITLKEKSSPPGRPFNIFQRFFDFFQGLF
ncbi:MAG: hypothetical protein KJI69_01230 [Patescibacteria group bacterium]|nr:hypothetical protein [Patescibacteria group bacterium]